MPNARVDAAVRVFFADAINTYISRLSKADRPPQRGWATCDPQRTEKSEVPRGRGDSARSRRGSRPTRSIAPSWVCGLSSASPADFALARPHMCTSQFLRTFLSLSLSVYIHPCKQPTGSVSLENPAAKLAHTGHPIVTRQACEQEKLQITDTAERVQMSTPCGRHPTVSSPRGLQGRHQRAPPLQGRRLWRKTALHDTCSSPWPEPGGSGRELLLHHQLRPKAETRVLGLGQGDRHGEQLGRCWGHKGRIILRGTELINGTFMRPPRPTQATHPHGMAI